MKRINRLYILIALCVAVVIVLTHFDNPYLNIATFAVCFPIYCCVGAWICDTLTDKERKTMCKFLRLLGIKNID